MMIHFGGYRHITWVKEQVENNMEVPEQIANVHRNVQFIEDLESVRLNIVKLFL